MTESSSVRSCRDLRYTTDSFSCFTIFQRKIFMKFTGILFDVPEGLLTAKTAKCNDLIVSLPGNK